LSWPESTGRMRVEAPGEEGRRDADPVAHRLQAAQREIYAADSRIRRLESQLADHRSQLERARAEASAARSRVLELERANTDDHDAEADGLRIELAALRDQHERAIDQLRRQETDVEALRRTLTVTRAEAAAARDRERAIAVALDAVQRQGNGELGREDVERMQADPSALETLLREELADARAAAERSRREYEDEARLRATREDELTAAQRELRVLARARSEGEAARIELETTAVRLAHMEREQDAGSEAARALQDRVTALEAELISTTVALADSQERVARLTVELDDLRLQAGEDHAALERQVVRAQTDTPAEAEPATPEIPPRAEAAQLLARARTLRSERRLEDALEAAERALEVRPGWRDAVWMALGLMARLSKTDAFDTLVLELGDLSERPTRDLHRLAPLALRAASHRLALETGELLVAADPGDRRGLYVTAAATWELGDEEGASRLVEQAIAAHGRSGILAALDFNRHIDAFERIPALLEQLDPPDTALMIEFASALVRRGDARPALELIDRAVSAGADPAGVADLRGRAEAELRLHNGGWAPGVPKRSIVSVPGRVLHLVSHSLPHHTSGGTYRTHYLTKAQRDAGLSPYVVTQLGFPRAKGAGPVAEADELDGITYRRLLDDEAPDLGPDERLARSLQQLIPIVERLQPAVVHAHSDFFNALLALALRDIYDIPVVYEIRGFPEERKVRRPGSRALNDQGFGRRLLELHCMNGADRLVTLAEVMKAHIVGRGVEPGKIHVVPNAVDPEALRPIERDAELMASLGLDDAEAVLGYVSTFYGYEGIRYIIEATAELTRRGRRVKALLVGDGREREPLERLTKELGVEDLIVFTGRVPHDQVLAHYRCIDLFVVPRRAEATSELVTPLKPYEAMAAGLAVIASDVGALREMVRDGETGRLFRPDDPIHLADVAEELINHPTELRGLGLAAREWVTANRDWAANGERYVALYAEMGAA
jgi:glycosyltransferase involved in cell wall biosynthesis